MLPQAHLPHFTGSNYPVCDEISPHYYKMSGSALFKWFGTHLAAPLCIFQSVIKFRALYTQKSLMLSWFCHSPAHVFIHSLDSHGQWLCEWTQNMHCNACWQLTLFQPCMPVPTLWVFDTTGRDRAVLHVWTLPLYRPPFQNDFASALSAHKYR
jgi:hypothetical protein